jgi:hypothetical protein
MIKHPNNKIIIKNKSIIQENIQMIILIHKIKEEEKKINYKIKWSNLIRNKKIKEIKNKKN